MKVDGNKLTKNMTDNLKKNRWNCVFCENSADDKFDVSGRITYILKLRLMRNLRMDFLL